MFQMQPRMTPDRTPPAPGAGPEDFFALTPAEFSERLRASGLPAFRARQVLAWVYRRYESSFEAMTDLSAADRTALSGRFRLEPPVISQVSRSSDGMTDKLLLRLSDGLPVEGVVMLHPRRRPTLCVSMQVGCAQGCLFCATGAMGLARNMTAGEIVGQIWQLRRYLLRERGLELVPTLVFMGMGEPLDNEASLRQALEVLNGPDGFGLASRKLTISTVGGPDKILALASLGLQVQLAISLHAASDDLRGRLIPGQRGVAVQALVEAAREFFRKTGREVTFEYVVIDRVNDSEEEALRLARLLDGFQCRVNLIPLNPVSHNRMQPPGAGALRRFQAALTARGVKCTVRHSQGRDILAACGQLATRSRQREDDDPGRRCA
jgi:23S rRNA (adenine2503-C2)-methyltransferase